MTTRKLPAGWPVIAGLACIVAGLAMLGGAAYLNQRAGALTRPAAAAASAPPAPTPMQRHDNAVLVAPPSFTHLDDLGALFRIAKHQGVALGPITYSSEPVASLPVLMRVVELRVDEDYPKLKSFVAELLRGMPHAYLREIRVEQANAASARVQASLKLSFVYQTGTDTSAPPGAMHGQRP
jgi:hypothetical protein